MTCERTGTGSPPAYQTTHFYYDGVRRIQEVTEGSGQDPDQTRAEYVYGPDYVDEFILQTYRDGNGNQQPMYMLQDANYNVVALIDSSTGVLEQYTWDPYGTLAIKDTLATNPAPVNRVGHQGLFWHSLDGSATFNAPNSQSNPTPTATGLYYSRNRWYAPHLGRFLQKDPNGAGVVLDYIGPRSGQYFSPNASGLSVAEHFADGMNLFIRAGLNPLTMVDAQGLDDWAWRRGTRYGTILCDLERHHPVDLLTSPR